MALYMVWYGIVYGMVYVLAWRGVAWYMLLSGGDGIVYGMACQV